MKIDVSSVTDGSPLSRPWCGLSSAVDAGVKVRRAFVHDWYVSLAHSHFLFPLIIPPSLSLSAACVGFLEWKYSQCEARAF